jgi:hypothetical protein
MDSILALSPCTASSIRRTFYMHTPSSIVYKTVAKGQQNLSAPRQTSAFRFYSLYGPALFRARLLHSSRVVHPLTHALSFFVVRNAFINALSVLLLSYNIFTANSSYAAAATAAALHGLFSRFIVLYF